MKVLIAVLCLLVAGIQSKAETSEKKYEKTYFMCSSFFCIGISKRTRI